MNKSLAPKMKKNQLVYPFVILLIILSSKGMIVKALFTITLCIQILHIPSLLPHLAGENNVLNVP